MTYPWAFLDDRFEGVDVAMLIAVGLLLVVLLTLATGYFVAQEFAYVSVDRTALRRLADEGDVPAQRALDITSRLSFALSGSQFGITVTALLVGYAGEPLIGTALADLLGATGLSYAVRLTVAVVLVLVLSTVLQMVIGELAPKNLAIARPVALARSLSRSTQAYLRVAGPLIGLFDRASNRLLRMVGIEPVEELAAGATTEDLEHLFEASRREGVLDDELSRLLERGIAFRTLTAAQAMTPRVAVVTASAAATLADVAGLLASSAHSRFPVVAHDVDDVVGVVGVADLVSVPRHEWSTTSVGAACSPAVVVPGSVLLPSALELLRASHRQLAVVVDEFGGFDGVLSLEDIAEEVVGDIVDEGDTGAPPSLSGSAHSRPASAPLSARLRIDEIETLTGVRLPTSSDYATVGGLVLERLGRVAQAGDVVVVDEVRDPTEFVDSHEAPTPDHIVIRVDEVERHVPSVVSLGRRPPLPQSESHDDGPGGRP